MPQSDFFGGSGRVHTAALHYKSTTWPNPRVMHQRATLDMRTLCHQNAKSLQRPFHDSESIATVSGSRIWSCISDRNECEWMSSALALLTSVFQEYLYLVVRVAQELQFFIIDTGIPFNFHCEKNWKKRRTAPKHIKSKFWVSTPFRKWFLKKGKKGRRINVKEAKKWKNWVLTENLNGILDWYLPASGMQ